MLQLFSATILPAPGTRRPRFAVLLAGGILFFLLLVFLNVGRWLVREDALRPASAIAVLSGRMPSRALEAARIYKQGYAQEVWLTRSDEPGATLEKLSLPYQGEEVYEKLVLIHEGVPETAIRVIEPSIVNTADEIRAIGSQLKNRNGGKVILVTSKVHTRRTGALWNRLCASSGEAIVRGDSQDEFEPAHWWRNTTDALDVVREILGLLNTWAGLPLKPETGNSPK
jgi:uncharacterized SAM-binding protein YcdF (DUF218 family)